MLSVRCENGFPTIITTTTPRAHPRSRSSLVTSCHGGGCQLRIVEVEIHGSTWGLFFTTATCSQFHQKAPRCIPSKLNTDSGESNAVDSSICFQLEGNPLATLKSHFACTAYTTYCKEHGYYEPGRRWLDFFLAICSAGTSNRRNSYPTAVGSSIGQTEG